MVRFKLKTSAIICFIWLLCAEYVRAQTEQPTEDDCTRDRECARHYLQARTLSKAGQFVDALEEYHAAYTLKPVPTLLFNIARISHKLSRPKEAINAYEAYLRQDLGTDPLLKEKAKEYLTQLSQQSELQLPSRLIRTSSVQTNSPLQFIAVKTPAPSELGTAPTPVYKRWWLWTSVGAAMLGGTIAVIIGAQTDFRSKPSAIIDLRGQL